MMSIVVSSGGAPAVGAPAAPRSKPVAGAADGFAQVLSGLHAEEVASEGIADVAGAPVGLLAAVSVGAREQEVDAARSGTTVPVEAVTPGEPWRALALAWSTATTPVADAAAHDTAQSDAASVLDVGAVAMSTASVTDADSGAPLGTAPPAPVDDQTAQVSTAVILTAPAQGSSLGVTSQVSEAGQAVTGSRVHAKLTDGPPAALPPERPPADAVPAGERPAEPAATDATPATAVLLSGEGTAGEPPSHDTLSEARHSHHRPSASLSDLVSAASDAGIEAAGTTPAGAAGVAESPERVEATPGGRQSDAAPSPTDGLSGGGAQPSVRVASESGLGGVAESVTSAASETAAAVVDQVVKSIRVQWKNGLGEARIQLRPEHLGPVEISIKVEGGAITAVVRAESSQVQEWILSHQQSLRQQLEAAGLRLDDLVVTPDAERRRQGDHPEDRQQAESRRRRVDGNAPTFEVIV